MSAIDYQQLFLQEKKRLAIERRKKIRNKQQCEEQQTKGQKEQQQKLLQQQQQDHLQTLKQKLKKQQQQQGEEIDFQALFREEKKRISTETSKNKQQQQQGQQQHEEEKEEKQEQKQQRQSKEYQSLSTSLSLKTPPLLSLWNSDQNNPCFHFSNQPKSIYYISNFLAEEPNFQKCLVDWLQSLPTASTDEAKEPKNGYWNVMKYGKRRVMMFDLYHNRRQKQDLLFPPLLQRVVDALQQPITKVIGKDKNDEDGSNDYFGFDTEQYPINHILINEYLVGQGIMSHTDGPCYYPKTATLSIGGGDVVIHFDRQNEGEASKPTPTGLFNATTKQHNKPQRKTKKQQESQQQLLDQNLQVFLEGNGSLLIFEKEAYSHYGHGIRDHIDVEYIQNPLANNNGNRNNHNDNFHSCSNGTNDDRSIDTDVNTNCINISTIKNNDPNHQSDDNENDNNNHLGKKNDRKIEVRRGYRISLTFRHKYK